MAYNLTDEFQRLSGLIHATPLTHREGVKKYHEGIIEVLDSGEIIPVPGTEHKLLHQTMWMVGHYICNFCPDKNVSAFCFLGMCSECEKRKNGACAFEVGRGLESERERFDIWYSKTYTLENKNDWEQKVNGKANVEAMGSLGVGLEEAVISLD